MFSDPVIKVEGLSKCFSIFAQPADRLKQFILPRIQRLAGMQPKRYFEDFWALKDINFQVERGETVGIIGRNGSGKSTLLQLICGTLTPSSGHTDTRGRIAALLELGSGFNPEFTGRDNVYLNASVLGLSRKQVDERYQDIINFADIGDFVDQPVKTYSSGMMVRLAFAVIAHVDADILIIDEALAVGDAVFTQKCMRWLRNFQKNGTILFVSHDTGSVLNLCDRAIWLKDGVIEQKGSAKEVVESYMEYTSQKISGDAIRQQKLERKNEALTASQADKKLFDYKGHVEAKSNLENSSGWKTGAAEIISISIESLSIPDKTWFEGGERVQVVIRAVAHEALDRPILGFLFRDKLGQDLFGENTLPVTGLDPVGLVAGEHVEAKFEFVLPMLRNGTYEVMASIANGTLENHVQHHWLNDALFVQVNSSQVRWGLVGLPFHKVSMEKVDV